MDNLCVGDKVRTNKGKLVFGTFQKMTTPKNKKGRIQVLKDDGEIGHITIDNIQKLSEEEYKHMCSRNDNDNDGYDSDIAEYDSDSECEMDNLDEEIEERKSEFTSDINNIYTIPEDNDTNTDENTDRNKSDLKKSINRIQKTKLETKKYYDNRCCITGFELGYDHAHISPGGWKENDTLSNSFLMDKTLHSLYDNKVGAPGPVFSLNPKTVRPSPDRIFDIYDIEISDWAKGKNLLINNYKTAYVLKSSHANVVKHYEYFIHENYGKILDLVDE